MVNREKFDKLLVDKAIEQNVEFRQQEQVVVVRDGAEHVEVQTVKGVYQARYVVAADGATGTASRLVRQPYGRGEIMAAVVSSVPAERGKTGDVLEMYFGIAPRGYGWVFPHGAYNSVGVMGLASRFSDAQQCLTDFSRSRNITLTAARGHTIPLGGIERKLAAGRILLVGDAAGFADPFHGEGMGNSMLSGTLAAQAIAAQGADPERCRSWYSVQCKKQLTRDLKIGLRMSRLLERYPRFFVTLFFRHKKTLERYVDIALNKCDHARFQRWVLLRLPFFLLAHAAARFRERQGTNGPAATADPRDLA